MRERQVSPGASHQRGALAGGPAETRARVGEVEDERQDVVAPVVGQPAVVALGGGRVDVEREDRTARIGGDAAVAARVGAEVPDRVTLDRRDELRDQPLLGGRPSIRIARVVGVLRPFGAGRLPVELGDRAAQARDQSPEAGSRDGGPPRRRSPIVGHRMTGLCPGVQVQVCQQPEVEVRAPGQQACREIERDAVRIGPQEAGQADVAARHEGEGREEVLAELAVAHPGHAVLVGLEREQVDQDGASASELDVVRGGIAQGPAGIECLELDVERQQGRVLELTERPLVRVGDELDRLGRSTRVRRSLRRGRVRRAPRGSAASLDEARGEVARGERVPVGARRLRPGEGCRHGGRRSRRGRGRSLGRG